MMSGKVRGRGRPRKSNINQRDANVNLDLDNNLLLEYEIKNCSVELTPINIEQSAMDETSPTPPPVTPKRRGRKPKNALAAKVNETPLKPTQPSDDTKPTEGKTESIADESMEKAEKPVKLSLSERKQARKAQIEAIIASGGRGMRTRKPNPKYMDEPAVSGNNLSFRDDDEENAEGEDGDDEMNLSSDDLPRNEGPLKKRMLQKIGIKSGPGRKPGSGKGTPGRKPSGIVAIKRKLDIDIDIDDEHGKQLFLDAKRRFQNSPSGSEDDGQLKKSKSPITDALAAKLRSKYPNDSFTVKRTVGSPINRVRLLERNKLAVQKDGRIELRHRKFTEDTETSEDDFGRGASDQDGSSPKNINRRKTQHTKILSDDRVIRPSSSGTPNTIFRKQVGNTMAVTKPINKSPLAQSQLIQSKLSTSGTVAKTYSISSHSRVIGTNKPAILRQPPRILNSTLCKPTNKVTVPSLVTKVLTKDDYESELSKKRNNNIISSRSKENNVTSYVYTEKDGKMIPKKQVIQSSTQKLMQQSKTALPLVRTPTQQRIVSEPVTMNIPNSRRIRKITCFETWYVIKMIEEQPKVEKSILNLSLMQIGNEIKKIQLPSSEWNYKILLQPLNKHFLALRQTKANKNSADTKSKETEDKKAAAEKPNETENKSDTKESDTKSNVKSETEDIKEETSSKDKEQSTKSSKEEDSNAEDDDSAASSEEKEPKEESKSADKKAEVKSEDKKEEVKVEPKSEKDAESSETTEEQKEQKSDELEKSTDKSESNVHDVYSGEVHDPNINPDDRHNYRPINIMFRRKCQNPNIRIQFDRTVILKNQTFYLNVDGKNVRLVASPQQIDTYDDIATLLQIVNDISLNSCCVELSTHIG